MIKKELPDCPIATTISLISDKWKTFVIRELLSGKKRFGELHHNIHGVSQKVLTDKLRAMERDGLVTRTVFPEVPPHVEYELSELGQSLVVTMESVTEWGKKYQELVRSGKINGNYKKQ